MAASADAKHVARETKESERIMANMDSETYEHEFTCVEDIEREEERLLTEIENRVKCQRTINSRIARVHVMRKFLALTSPQKPRETSEQSAKMTRRITDAIHAYIEAVNGNISLYDEFQIVDDKGEKLYDAKLALALTNKRATTDKRDIECRIVLDVHQNEVTRSGKVFYYQKSKTGEPGEQHGVKDINVHGTEDSTRGSTTDKENASSDETSKADSDVSFKLSRKRRRTNGDVRTTEKQVTRTRASIPGASSSKGKKTEGIPCKNKMNDTKKPEGMKNEARGSKPSIVSSIYD